MQLRTFFLPVSVLATTAALSPAIAQDFYVEGAVGAMEETTYISSNSNLDTNVVGGRVGWEVTPYVAVEGEYFVGLNEHEEKRSVLIPSGERFDVTSELSIASTYGVFGKVSLPVGDSLELFARAGYANVKKDSKSQAADENSTTSQGSFDEDDIALGIGASFDLTDRIYARLDATSYDLAQENNSITIGAGIRF